MKPLRPRMLHPVSGSHCLAVLTFYRRVADLCHRGHHRCLSDLDVAKLKVSPKLLQQGRSPVWTCINGSLVRRTVQQWLISLLVLPAALSVAFTRLT